MAYAVEHSGKRRAQALVAVGALHGVAIWAIVSGFAGGVMNVVRDSLVAQQWKDEVKITPVAPPPPQREKAKASKQAEATAPDSTIRLATADEGFVIKPADPGPVLPFEGEVIRDVEVTPSPSPRPSPSFIARAAVPKGAPGAWVSNRDYPTAAIREERQGVTRFALRIGPDGRVTSCEVTG
ncbi:energy transducer TonB [Novosphingobium sp. B1]|uniref:energy transducer TonB n=1 Tax=Novosphingobium sp. B1 TaxID=1938756 RepID=UPI0009D85E56|nr:energy transducer TonB [Novosphingobium sp. B1]SMC67294.1 protein TonB [Novosphingobium sp. B1]